jgi:hypothetical protein
MHFGAPGRTRTGSLLFRRWLSADAVLEPVFPSQSRPTSESYRVVGSSRDVPLSNKNALSRYRAFHHTVDARSQRAAHSLTNGHQGDPSAPDLRRT